MATGREFEVYPDRRKIAERRARERAEGDRRRDPGRFDVGMLDRPQRGTVHDTLVLARRLGHAPRPFPLDPALVGRDALVRRAYDAEVRR